MGYRGDNKPPLTRWDWLEIAVIVLLAVCLFAGFSYLNSDPMVIELWLRLIGPSPPEGRFQ